MYASEDELPGDFLMWSEIIMRWIRALMLRSNDRLSRGSAQLGLVIGLERVWFGIWVSRLIFLAGRSFEKSRWGFLTLLEKLLRFDAKTCSRGEKPVRTSGAFFCRSWQMANTCQSIGLQTLTKRPARTFLNYLREDTKYYVIKFWIRDAVISVSCRWTSKTHKDLDGDWKSESWVRPRSKFASTEEGACQHIAISSGGAHDGLVIRWQDRVG